VLYHYYEAHSSQYGRVFVYLEFVGLLEEECQLERVGSANELFLVAFLI